MGATCVNEIGNYTCLCPNGYLSDWNKCVGKLDALTQAYNESESGAYVSVFAGGL